MKETVFTYGAPALKFGPGAADEIGYDLQQYDARRVLVVTDPGVARTGHPERVAEGIRSFGLEVVVSDLAHVEPTDESLQAAIDHARENGPWDAFVAVGGGSAIDTAKAVNLLTSNDGDLMDYVNLPVGKGLAPARPLKPFVAVPTTTGTGSESTTICVLDVLAQRWTDGELQPAPSDGAVATRLDAIRPRDDGAAGAARQQHRLVAHAARIAVRVHPLRPGIGCAPIAAADDPRRYPPPLELTCEPDDDRRLPGAADRQVADTDHRQAAGRGRRSRQRREGARGLPGHGRIPPP